jgi:serine/tyrosine/threonine adenylyltransferase
MSTDESEYFKPLLNIMETHKLDFHSTFRTLCSFKPSMLPTDTTKASTPSPIEALITKLLAATPDPQRLDHSQATSDWLAWLDKYARRIESERGEWGSDVDADAERERAARGANPRFVLRQWVLEEVIKKVEMDADSGRRVLAKVMHVRSFLFFFPPLYTFCIFTGMLMLIGWFCFA